MATQELHVSPLGRVEGDLDVKVKIDDGVVSEAWTEAAMFRGFEIILKGKDPQAGLIVTPRICGICGGSHLFKSVYALDTAWKTDRTNRTSWSSKWLRIDVTTGGGGKTKAKSQVALCRSIGPKLDK